MDRKPFDRREMAAGMLLALFLAAGAEAAQVVVPGSANPNLAGRAGGYTCCSGDSSPLQAPVLIDGFEGCEEVSFGVLGKVSFEPGIPTGHNPDGDSTFSMVNYGDGISAPENVRVNALVGVFLDEDSPTGEATPERLDFAELGLGFSTLEPELRQIFFIGDGLTTDSASDALTKSSSPRGSGANTQVFVAPAGAKRLYLGTVDGSGWFNNSGSFQVEALLYPDENQEQCGDVADPPGIFASDALAVLRGAVGTEVCGHCRCDVNHSGSVVTNDALAVLRRAVGQDVDLECPCCRFE